MFVMSWGGFDEFKSFASKIKDQSKRKKDWNKPLSKRHKSSGRSSIKDGNGIDGFSSDEEEHEEHFLPRTLNGGNAKLDNSIQKGLSKGFLPSKRVKQELDGSIYQIDDSEEILNNNDSKSTDVSAMAMKHGHESDVEASKLINTLDVMIKDFNSSDEEEVKSKKEQEPEIDALTPTPKESVVYEQRKPNKESESCTTASEWLKKVKNATLKSKHEAAVSDDNVMVEVDSAKKTRQKFKRNGLAEQLQKVINREKSEKTFWIQKQTTGCNYSSTCLDVQILSIDVQFSLTITRCCVLDSTNSKPSVVDVVFNDETSRQIVPRVGSAVRIHPPWQTLHPTYSPYPIFLCTFYSEKLPTPPNSPVLDLLSIKDAFASSSKEDSRSQSQRKGFKPSKLVFDTSTAAESKPNHSQTPTALPSIAEAIQNQGGCSGENVSFSAVIQRIYRKRVKIPRDKTIDSPGHLFLSKSLITRARNGEDKEELRWFLLAQDSRSHVCEIQIPTEFAQNDDWNFCIRNGEGKQYNFVNLMIFHRVNRTRSPGLFSVVDSLWRTKLANESQEEGSCQEDRSSVISTFQESIAEPPLPSPPGYCYVFTVQESSSTVMLSDNKKDSSFMYKPPTITTLQNIMNDNKKPTRLSTWCRVIFSCPSSPTKTTAPRPNCQRWTGQLFVTDSSLNRISYLESEPEIQYLKIIVRPSFAMTDNTWRAIVEAGCVLYIQDIMSSCVESHNIFCVDSYSTIKKGATDPCQEDLNTGDVKVMPLSVYSDLVAMRTQNFIPFLSQASQKESLCRIEGMIKGVNEESACCWLECAACACQDLLERKGLPYYCPVCQQDIPDPVTKTNLEVIIACNSWIDAHVNVMLLQTTIEQVLPVSYQESDQGYDIDHVLGKKLGPLFCYIKDISDLNVKLEEIYLTL